MLPHAGVHDIGVLAYGPLAHGLLGGAITGATRFGASGWRSHSPAFTGPAFERNLEVVAALPPCSIPAARWAWRSASRS